MKKLRILLHGPTNDTVSTQVTPQAYDDLLTGWRASLSGRAADQGLLQIGGQPEIVLPWSSIRCVEAVDV